MARPFCSVAETYNSRKAAERKALPARMAALWEERRNLLIARDFAMSQQWVATANARLNAIGMETAQRAMLRESTRPLATWGDAA